MGTVCPQGHDSASSDFCDVCGTRISSSLSRPDGMTREAPRGRAVRGQRRRQLPALRVGRGRSVLRGVRIPGFRPAAFRPSRRIRRSVPPLLPPRRGETAPSGPASSGPPESLFPPIPKPEPPFSAWSKPQPFPSSPPPSSPPPQAAPGGGWSARPSVPQAADVPEAPETPEEPGVAGLLESLFSPASRTSSPPPASPPPMASPPPASPPSPRTPTPPAARPEPSYPAPAPVSRPEPPTGPQFVRAPAPCQAGARACAPARALRAAVLV